MGASLQSMDVERIARTMDEFEARLEDVAGGLSQVQGELAVLNNGVARLLVLDEPMQLAKFAQRHEGKWVAQLASCLDRVLQSVSSK